MRKLEVDFEELAMAMESYHSELEWFLDLETGDVVPCPDESFGDLEDDDLSELMESNPDRFQPVPTISSHEGYEDMEMFAGSMKDPALAQQLQVALNGRGAFRRFKDVLIDHPVERERWFQFQAERMEERIREWFEMELEIEPIPKRRPF